MRFPKLEGKLSIATLAYKLPEPRLDGIEGTPPRAQRNQ